MLKYFIVDAFLQLNDILEISGAWVKLGYTKHKKLHVKALIIVLIDNK